MAMKSKKMRRYDFWIEMRARNFAHFFADFTISPKFVIMNQWLIVVRAGLKIRFW